MRKVHKGSILVALAASGTLVLAVGALAAPSATTATTVGVTAGKPSEFRFTLSKRSVPKGTVVFNVVNKGAIEHNFKIAGKTSPTLKRGKSATLKVTFRKAGRYAYVCTLAGHAPAGMKGVLVVK